MPEIGEIRYGREIGRQYNNRFIWVACNKCGKQRWVREIGGEPTSKFCNSCAMGKLRGALHPNWKGGRTVSGKGYILILLQPEDFFYPMTNKVGQIQEHRLVVAKALGRCLHDWEEVHHKGAKYPRGSREDKSDNRYPENLELMIKGCHTAEHQKGYSNGYLKGLTDGRLKQMQELKEQNDELIKQIKLLQWQVREFLREGIKG